MGFDFAEAFMASTFEREDYPYNRSNRAGSSTGATFSGVRAETASDSPASVVALRAANANCSEQQPDAATLAIEGQQDWAPNELHVLLLEYPASMETMSPSFCQSCWPENPNPPAAQSSRGTCSMVRHLQQGADVPGSVPAIVSSWIGRDSSADITPLHSQVQEIESAWLALQKLLNRDSAAIIEMVAGPARKNTGISCEGQARQGHRLFQIGKCRRRNVECRNREQTFPFEILPSAFVIPVLPVSTIRWPWQAPPQAL